MNLIATLTLGSQLNVKCKGHETKGVFKWQTHSHKWGRM